MEVGGEVWGLEGASSPPRPHPMLPAPCSPSAARKGSAPRTAPGPRARPKRGLKYEFSPDPGVGVCGSFLTCNGHHNDFLFHVKKNLLYYLLNVT